MTAQRQVWTSAFADVQIFLENASGTVLDTNTLEADPSFDPNDQNRDYDPVLSYCYLQNASMTSSAEIMRRAVTGRARRKLTIREFDDCKVDCECMFFHKSDEINFNQIFNRRQRLRLVLRLINPSYSGDAPYTNDTMQMKRSLASSFGVSERDNDVLMCNASFEGEEVI